MDHMASSARGEIGSLIWIPVFVLVRALLGRWLWPSSEPTSLAGSSTVISAIGQDWRVVGVPSLAPLAGRVSGRVSGGVVGVRTVPLNRAASGLKRGEVSR